MQIVIAETTGTARSPSAITSRNVASDSEPAIDEVAGEPQRRVGGGRGFGEELLERRAAALQVAKGERDQGEEARGGSRGCHQGVGAVRYSR